MLLFLIIKLIFLRMLCSIIYSLDMVLYVISGQSGVKCGFVDIFIK
jgi:hypothetical protein